MKGSLQDDINIQLFLTFMIYLEFLNCRDGDIKSVLTNIRLKKTFYQSLDRRDHLRTILVKEKFIYKMVSWLLIYIESNYDIGYKIIYNM